MDAHMGHHCDDINNSFICCSPRYLGCSKICFRSYGNLRRLVMPQQRNPQMTTRNETKTVLTDADGNPILEIGTQEYMVRDSSGALIHRSINENTQLVCGTLWNPLMMLTKPPVYIGVCGQCHKGSVFRASKGHGIVAMHRAKLCTDCGQLWCPRHRKLRDNRWRCLSCARRHRIVRLIRPIFFAREGD